MECDGRGLPQRGFASPTNGGARTWNRVVLVARCCGQAGGDDPLV